MNRSLVLLTVTALAFSLAHGQSKTGTTVGQFLMIEPSARIGGMGNAGATMNDEIDAAYYNPAAIGHLTQSGVQFTHSPWLAGITFDYAGAALTLGNFGNLYGSVTALNSGDIAVRKSALGVVRTILKVESSTFVTDLISELSPYPPKTVMS